MCVQEFSKVRNRQDIIFHLRSEPSNLLTSGVPEKWIPNICTMVAQSRLFMSHIPSQDKRFKAQRDLDPSLVSALDNAKPEKVSNLSNQRTLMANSLV